MEEEYIIYYNSGRYRISDSEPSPSDYEEARESEDPISYVEEKED